jgi:hypothetical protein
MGAVEGMDPVLVFHEWNRQKLATIDWLRETLPRIGEVVLLDDPHRESFGLDEGPNAWIVFGIGHTIDLDKPIFIYVERVDAEQRRFIEEAKQDPRNNPGPTGLHVPGQN